MTRIRIFVSYCRRDDQWVKEGEFGLIPWLAKSLARRNVDIWYDQALRDLPGEDYKRKIKDEIDQACFSILLISQDFLNSDFIRRYEMPWIKARLDKNEMTVIPILVDHTLWEYEDELKWITDRQMLPGTPTPLIEFTTDLPPWRRVRAEILRAVLHRIQEARELRDRDRSEARAPADLAAEDAKELRSELGMWASVAYNIFRNGKVRAQNALGEPFQAVLVMTGTKMPQRGWKGFYLSTAPNPSVVASVLVRHVRRVTDNDDLPTYVCVGIVISGQEGLWLELSVCHVASGHELATGYPVELLDNGVYGINKMVGLSGYKVRDTTNSMAALVARGLSAVGA